MPKSTPEPSPAPIETFTMPLSAKFVKAIITEFAAPPVMGDDSWQTNSIGIASESIVATDSRSAILIGKTSASGHVATLRKEALIECERAKQYGDAVKILDIPRNVDAVGVVKQMPDVQRAVRAGLDKMRPVAVVDPYALLAIAKVAIAANALSIELMQPSDPTEVDSLGFEFHFEPLPEHTNLFTEWEGSINARGIFMARRSERKSTDDEPGLPDVEPVTPASTRQSRDKVTVGATAGVSTPDEDSEPASPPAPRPFDVDEERKADILTLPRVSMLKAPDQDEVTEKGEYSKPIIDCLMGFNIPARMAGYQRGPVITQYQVEIPKQVKTSRIADLSDNLKMTLAVKSIRVEAPIPGMNAIGIEVPNKVKSLVYLRDLVASHEFFDAAPLTVAIGQDVGGRSVYADLAKMPHLLVAGATGAGKSIGLATIIMSLLMRNSPRDLRMVMIDPKRVELTLFDGIPHLMCPVVKDIKEAPGVLRAVWREMDARYDRLNEEGVRNIESYNAKATYQDRMPYIVVVIDEMADLMMSARAETETTIVKLAQLSRAVGIHLVVATQRPSVDVITGVMKANIPSRLAYAVASGIDSRVILDGVGAENLLGSGDALFQPIGGKPQRIQGSYVSEQEIADVCTHWRNQESPVYVMTSIMEGDDESEERQEGAGTVDDEKLFEQAVVWAVERGQASTSMLQRKFSIGFQKASRILDRMEAKQIVGPRDGPRPRDVLVSDVEAALVLARGAN